MKARKSPVAEAMKAKGSKIEREFRSDIEKRVAEQLREAGAKFAYEEVKLPYVVPRRDAEYLPDFVIPGTNIIIEAKGHFGGLKQFGDMANRSVQVRQKMILVKEQHPELDIRILFDKRSSKTKLRKGSPTTQGKWASDHGFKWAEETIPPAWLAEILMQQQKKGKKKR